MPDKANFTAKLHNLDYLRALVAGMGFTLTRGRGAGREGSIKRFLDHLSAGEVVAFPTLWGADELRKVAERMDVLALDEYPGSPEQELLSSCAAALRTAAAPVEELDEPASAGDA